jgi:tRNA (guanine-N7-)-methyltransferase
MEFFDDRSLVGGTRREHPTGKYAPALEHPAFVQDSELAEFKKSWGHGDGPALIAEIGFARPYFMEKAAARRPRARFIGFEIRTKWVERLLRAVDVHGFANVRTLRGDFREYAEALFEPASLTALVVHFPDPWWKKRHGKKRLVDEAFVRAAGYFLRDGGFVVFRSDVRWYVDTVRELFLADGRFAEGPEPAWCAGFPSHRETVCARQGTPTWAAAYYKKPVTLGGGPTTIEQGTSATPSNGGIP